jgi:hypothetical protein
MRASPTTWSGQSATVEEIHEAVAVGAEEGQRRRRPATARASAASLSRAGLGKARVKQTKPPPPRARAPRRLPAPRGSARRESRIGRPGSSSTSDSRSWRRRGALGWTRQTVARKPIARCRPRPHRSRHRRRSARCCAARSAGGCPRGHGLSAASARSCGSRGRTPRAPRATRLEALRGARRSRPETGARRLSPWRTCSSMVRDAATGSATRAQRNRAGMDALAIAVEQQRLDRSVGRSA